MKHTAHITGVLVVFFLLSQLIGLAVINSYVSRELTVQAGKTAYSELPYGIERPEAPPLAAFAFIVSVIATGTVLFLLLIKFKKNILWKAWYFFAVTLAMSISLAAFIQQTAALVLGLAFGILKVFRPSVAVHNLTEVFIYGGLAIIFVPMLNIPIAVVLLLAISAYDAVAVWKTKHMIKLARFQAKSKMFAGLMLPYKTSGTEKARTEKSKTAVLGGGDMAFPLMFAGVVMGKVGFVNALVIPACAAIALFLLLYFGKKDRFYPAMPFITAGCLAGYGLTFLL